jgi:hypothetical protein
MTVLHNNGGKSVPQSRRVSGSYKLTIEARAALAVGLIENGWSQKDAAAALCVNDTYLRLARRLGDADRQRLARSELKLAQVHRDYYQRLADRRAKAARTIVVRVRRNGRSAVLSDSVLENLVREVGVDRVWRALDRITAPPEFPLLAAE